MHLKSRKLARLLPLAAIGVFLVVTFGVSCAPTSAVAKGWAGVATADGKLFVGSMEGKLIALDANSRNRLWSDHAFTSTQGGGFLSCGPVTTAVAIYGTPAIGKDLVYVAGYDGKVYAINAATGADRWVYPRQGTLQPIVGGLLLASGRIYFGDSTGKVYALDAETGDRVWEAQIDDDIWSSPAIEGSTLYIGSFDKKLHALDIQTGKEKWATETGGAIASSPVIRGNTVYIGSFDRKLYAIDTAFGNVKWQSSQAGNWFWARPVTTDGTIYAGSLDGKVYAFNTENGATLAEIDLGGPLSSSPVLSDGQLVAATERGQVYAIDPKTNQKRQLATLKESIFAPLTADGAVVYVHSAKDILYAINIQSGTALWNMDLKAQTK